MWIRKNNNNNNNKMRLGCKLSDFCSNSQKIILILFRFQVLGQSLALGTRPYEPPRLKSLRIPTQSARARRRAVPQPRLESCSTGFSSARTPPAACLWETLLATAPAAREPDNKKQTKNEVYHKKTHNQNSAWKKRRPQYVEQSGDDDAKKIFFSRVQ